MKLFKDATIMPLEGTMDSFTGGIFTSAGQFVGNSIVHRGKQPLLQKYNNVLSDTYIYGGCLFGHFGHFIWESLSRLYTILQCKNYPIVFITPNDKIYNSQRLFFKSIGIRNEICIVKIPTLMRNLLYSEPGSSVHPAYISEDQIDALQYFKFPLKEEIRKKIWLSRSLLKMGKITNEQNIESELRKFGYDIVHPQTLSLYDQVKMVSTADVVAGFDGSQFFSLLFAKEIRGKFLIFNRRKRIPETIPYVLGKRNVSFILHDFDVEHVNGQGAGADFYHHEADNVIDACKAYT